MAATPPTLVDGHRGALAARVERFAPPALAAAGTAVVALLAVSAVLARAGHPAVPLDDAFIHFQYAKRLAGGHFFSYVDGDGYSSGATSLLWPALLAPFYLLGLRSLAIIWAAWGLGFLALGALAVESYRLAAPLAGRGAAAGAGAMVLCFGGYLWCAASGMEVVPLAWALAFAARRAIEWGEAPAEARSPRLQRGLVATALLAPLVRPEGGLASLVIAAVLLFFPRASPGAARHRASGLVRRWPAALALSGPMVVPLVNLALSGRAASSTTTVKWLPGNPYYGHGAVLVAAIAENVSLLFRTLLDGREWSAVYLPSGARPFAIAALLAIPTAGWLRGKPLRAAVIAVMALGILVPCTYLTFLWNRLRYLWPFAFAWFIGLSCLASSVAEILASLSPRLRWAGPALSGLFAASLTTRLEWTIADLAESASAIDRQQVALGWWAREALPADAVIGVNDTGAIAYLSERRTFDVVGLTTPSEAPYWVAGAGSRFEHYEALVRAAPARFPSHFIVYPQWMACDPVLGDELHEATVLDQSILGGTTMTAFTARRDRLGSGDRPFAPPAGDPIDELDVADLESEAAHGYEVGPSRETDDAALDLDVGDGAVADGARVRRAFDRFSLATRGGGPLRLVGRWTSQGSGGPAVIEVLAGAGAIGRVELAADGWTEAALDVPPPPPGEPLRVAVRALAARFGSAHYWLYATRQ